MQWVAQVSGTARGHNLCVTALCLVQLPGARPQQQGHVKPQSSQQLHGNLTCTVAAGQGKCVDACTCQQAAKCAAAAAHGGRAAARRSLQPRAPAPTACACPHAASGARAGKQKPLSRELLPPQYAPRRPTCWRHGARRPATSAAPPAPTPRLWMHPSII